ncbi:hypothetical protein EON80_19070, partial [bacterium]
MKKSRSHFTHLILMWALAFSATAPVQFAKAQSAPQGASRVNDSALAEKLGSFLQAEAKERKLPSGSGQAAQLWFWNGASYK